MFLLVLFLVELLLYSASAIRCYSCTSKNSWTDCKSRDKEIYCTGKSVHCLKITYDEKHAGNQVYQKTCTQSDLCSRNTRTECKDLGSIHKCDVSCCSEDLCNASFCITRNIVWVILAVSFARLVVQR